MTRFLVEFPSFASRDTWAQSHLSQVHKTYKRNALLSASLTEDDQKKLEAQGVKIFPDFTMKSHEAHANDSSEIGVNL